MAYTQTPTGRPQSITSDPGYNDLTNFSSQTSAARRALIDRMNAESSGAYDRFAGETGLREKADILSRITGDMAATGVRMADVPLEVNKGVEGSFANDNQRQTEIGSNLVPLQALYTKIGTALPGASQAYSTAQQATQTKLQVFQDAQARTLSGFDRGAEQELAALQDKVARGRQLTDQEFDRQLQLSLAKMQYDAQIKSANIGAGATMGAARIGADASLKSAGLQYPGINLTQDANGNWIGQMPSYLKPGSTQTGGQVSPQAVQNALNKYAPQNKPLYGGGRAGGW